MSPSSAHEPMSFDQEVSSGTRSSRVISCALCQRRKVKCDKQIPCSYCKRHRVQCVPATPAPPRPRKKRFAEAELLVRLRRYEVALRSAGVDPDAINNSTAESEALDDSRESFEKTPSSDLSSTGISSFRKVVKDEPGQWENAQDEFETTQEMLRGSSEDEIDEHPITATYNTMFDGDAGGLLFDSCPLDLDLAAIHPETTQIFGLWQNFIDNVHPLVKIIHVPTIQPQIIKASADLNDTSPALHALMFGIYASAARTLDETECITVYHEQKALLLHRWHFGAQSALRRADYLRSSDIMVLQALVLYLTSLLQQVDPRSHFCLVAIAERIARRNGLHRDFPPKGLSPFEVEMRKRLWWSIVFLDRRLAEISGAGPSMVSPLWSTKIPLSINDSNMSPDLTKLQEDPTPSTEMIFFLIRCEIAEFLRKIRFANGVDTSSEEFGNPLMSIEEKERIIADFEQHLQTKYLQYCDPEIPLHLIAIAEAKSSIGKMRFTTNYVRLRQENMTEADKEHLFRIALELVEHYNPVKLHRGLRRFKWCLQMNRPFIGMLHLLISLRQRTVGELADRGWTAIITLMDSIDRPHPIMRRNMHGLTPQSFEETTLQMAFANLIVKAWEAREAALSREEGPVPVPPLILHMRNKLERRKLNSNGTSPNTGDLSLSDSSNPPSLNRATTQSTNIWTLQTPDSQQQHQIAQPYNNKTAVSQLNALQLSNTTSPHNNPPPVPIPPHQQRQIPDLSDTSMMTLPVPFPAPSQFQFGDTMAEMTMDFWNELLPDFPMQDGGEFNSDVGELSTYK